MKTYRGYTIQASPQGFVILWSGGILGGRVHDTEQEAEHYIDAILIDGASHDARR